MSYVHTENNHRITFADEEDYLRARLIYLEQFQGDVSTSYSFTFFIERRLYRGLENHRRGRIEISNIEHIETFNERLIAAPNGSSLYVNSNRDSYGAFARQGMVDRLGDIAPGWTQNRASEQLREEGERVQQQSRLNSQFQELLTLGGFPTTVVDPPLLSEIGFSRESQAEHNDPIRVPLIDETFSEVDKKEDVVEEKPNKKKSIFDIIDID